MTRDTITLPRSAAEGVITQQAIDAQAQYQAAAHWLEMDVRGAQVDGPADDGPALLQVGDEVLIVTGQAQSVIDPEAPMVNNVEFRNSGVILKVLPRVTAHGTINLIIEQEISSVANWRRAAATDARTVFPSIRNATPSGGLAANFSSSWSR